MSEKRFVYHEEYFPLNVREIVDNEIGEAYDCEDATDVLNELFDENEQLKKENNHLKDDFQYYMTKSATLETELLRLRKENEQLKQKLEILALNGKKNDSIKMIDGKVFIRM